MFITQDSDQFVGYVG